MRADAQRQMNESRSLIIVLGRVLWLLDGRRRRERPSSCPLGDQCRIGLLQVAYVGTSERFGSWSKAVGDAEDDVDLGLMAVTSESSGL